MILKISIGLIGFLLLIALIDYIRRKFFRGKQEEKNEPVQSGCDREKGCCGKHEQCEKLNLFSRIRESIDYFDDEELDVYAGKEADTYSEAEIEEFREIIRTMNPEEVPDWLESLKKRKINLPDPLKQEMNDKKL